MNFLYTLTLYLLCIFVFSCISVFVFNCIWCVIANNVFLVTNVLVVLCKHLKHNIFIMLLVDLT